MWIVLLAGSIAFIIGTIKTNRILVRRRNSLYKINKKVETLKSQRRDSLEEAVEVAEQNNLVIPEEYEDCNEAEKCVFLTNLISSNSVYRENTDFCNHVKTANKYNGELKNKRKPFHQQTKQFNELFTKYPSKIFSWYLGYSKDIRDYDPEDKKEKDQKEHETRFLLIKSFNVISVWFALSGLYYCLFGRDSSPSMGVMGVLIIAFGIFSSYFLFKQLKPYLWAIWLATGAVCFMGVFMAYSVNEPIRRKQAAEAARIEEQARIKEFFKPRDTYIENVSATATTAIKSVSDVDNILNTLNKYARNDLEVGFSKSSGNVLMNKMDSLLERATIQCGVPTNYFKASFNGTRKFNKKAATLYSIALFVPKNGRTIGKVKLNYKLDLDFAWGDSGSEDRGRLRSPVYVSYVWTVDLDNPKKPVADYNKFIFDYSNSNIDFDNWYQANIESEKSNNEVSERILSNR